MAETRENSKLKGVRLPDALKISGDLSCLKGAELVVCAAPSFAVRETGKKIAPYLTPETVLVSVSKGIERDTNLRMSQISGGSYRRISVKYLPFPALPTPRKSVSASPPAACPPAGIWARRASCRMPL